MFVSDLRHLLDMPDDAPAPARRMAEHLARIVEAGTTSPVGEPTVTSIRCTRRPGRRPCAGLIEVVRLEVPASIDWWCPVCGDKGVVSGWEDSPFDLRRPPSHGDGQAEPLPERLGTQRSRGLPRVSGRWRIIEMELWDQDAIDLVGPAFIEFGPDNTGSFRFIAVEAWMDVRPSHRNALPGVEFTWDGYDEGDRTTGRGWATLGADGILAGRIFNAGARRHGVKSGGTAAPVGRLPRLLDLFTVDLGLLRGQSADRRSRERSQQWRFAGRPSWHHQSTPNDTGRAPPDV